MIRNNLMSDKNDNLTLNRLKKVRYILAAVIIAQCVLLAPRVQAASIVVNSPGDNNLACTLREAVQAINQGNLGTTGCTNSGGPFSGVSSITFQHNVNLITLSNAPLDINQSMQISAPNGVTIHGDAAFDDRLVTIDGPYSVGLIGLSFNGGTVVGLVDGTVIYVKSAVVAIRDSVIRDGAGGGSGGLFLDGATGLLINTTVTNNSSTLNGGGIEIVNNSTLTLSRSTISNNTADNLGGGIAVDFSSTATINTSTISGNTASTGGGINVQRTSNLTLNQSLVMGNSADDGAGGIRGSLNSNVMIANSTVSGNTAGKWGGGVYSRNSPISLVNSTVSNNTASLEGAGLYAFGKPSDGSLNFRLSNSIIANSSGSNDCAVSPTSISANRQNLIEDGSCGTAAIAADPSIGPLADNGGETHSHALLTNSPAISAGDNTVCAASPVNSLDQLGQPRANPDDTICDLGAVESPEGRAADTSSFFVIPTKNGNAVIFEL